MTTDQHGLSRREILRAAGLSGAAWGVSRIARAGESLELPQKEADAAKNSPVVLGYYPEWKPLDPAKLDLTVFTHVCHAFAAWQEGRLRFPTEEQTRTLIRAAHAAKVRVLLSVGGAESGAILRAQPPNALADTLAQRVRASGYDGLDLDWEFGESEADSAKISALALALRKRLPGMLLTMAVSAEDYYGRWFKTETLLPAVDWLNIMAYDFCGPWCDRALHNAPIPRVTASIDYWKGRGWPTQKLLLGIPGYGRRMRAARFGDPAPKGTYIGDEIAFTELEAFRKQGWKPMRDEEAQVPYLVKPQGGELISYEDEVSARRKGQLARTRGLRGVFFWEMTHDFDGKTHLLARAARQGWNLAPL